MKQNFELGLFSVCVGDSGITDCDTRGLQTNCIFVYLLFVYLLLVYLLFVE